MLSRVDEELLSAYLDGELRDEDARRVETAIADDHRLAEALRELRAVSDLVAELPRTPSPDISAPVLASLRGRAGDRRWWRGRRGAWVATGVAASTAASLLVAALVHGPAPWRRQMRPIPAGIEAASIAPAGGPPTIPAPISAAPIAKALPSARSGEAVARAVPALESPLDRERLRSVMDDLSLRRVFLITDRIGGEAEARVESLVEQSSRRDYFKVTISQGIVIDPLHPGEAVVFAVVLDEVELDPLRRGLEGEFGAAMKDAEIGPSLAMHIADVGQVVCLPARGAGVISFPTASMSLRTPGDLQPTPEQERSSPAADRRKAGAPASPIPPIADGPPLDDHPSVVLVWIERPGEG
ncbi:anti-sigma factor family protein [Aquisphaera insulae]|uniref:anti-sigma factor family protein n=1 Tax=Aquisphaera insulae TaxID=2712864 RepID=UPI0013ECF93C|nr:zf-HC2 domain-containing protein [Aquisphaera insulae]